MKKIDKKVDLSEAEINDLRLNLEEIEEKCEELNTAISALYLWLERIGLM